MFNVTYELMKKITEMLKHGDEPDKDFLRDSLSIGLVKIVNAVTDSKQLKGPTDKKLSMTEVADNIGFSVRAVRERNFIAHSQRTPCLRQLIECYHEIYRWTHIELWLPKVTEMINQKKKFELIWAFTEALTVPEADTLLKDIENINKAFADKPDLSRRRDIWMDNYIKTHMNKQLRWNLSLNQIQEICDKLVLGCIKTTSVQIVNEELLVQLFKEFKEDRSKVPATLSSCVTFKYKNRVQISTLLRFFHGMWDEYTFNTVLVKTLFAFLNTLIFEGEQRNFETDVDAISSSNFHYQLKAVSLIVYWEKAKLINVDTSMPTIMCEVRKLMDISPISFTASFVFNCMDPGIRKATAGLRNYFRTQPSEVEEGSYTFLGPIVTAVSNKEAFINDAEEEKEIVPQSEKHQVVISKLLGLGKPLHSLVDLIIIRRSKQRSIYSL